MQRLKVGTGVLRFPLMQITEGKLKPLIWSTDGNVVSGIYEDQGQRLILDGGFTRLFYAWDNAGTGRYVKNAAAWLVNYERFGELVLGEELKK